MSENVECPVCEQKYPRKEIDVHVNKCIFLNSTNEMDQTCKRSSETKSPQSFKKLRSGSSETQVHQNYHQNSHSTKNSNNPSTSEKNEIAVGAFPELNKGKSIPLAEMMRPSNLSQFVGQKHVLGPNKVLLNLIEGENIPSMILWGPPGCGKTTLAHIIAEKCKHQKIPNRFIKLSATMDGVKDVKDIVRIAKNELASLKRKTVLFMDEIHRFNKLQQDIFLPHVESGLITLIGATTENPSFSLNSALLSRCAVIVLEKLSTDDLYTVLNRAVSTLGGKVVTQFSSTQDGSSINGELRFKIDDASLLWLAEMCDGDARIALNSLHIALQAIKHTKASGTDCSSIVTLDHIKDGVKRSHMLYDKKGDEHYNTISALHKSVRAGDDNAALYWLARMLEGGEDPLFIARRLVRAASEDIGLADPNALQIAVSAMQGCQLLGMPECDVILAQCAVYLSRAPKSREMDSAIGKAREFVSGHKGPLPPVPLHLRNAPTRLMKNLNYGKGYNMASKEESGLTYLPEGLEDINFF